jgi:hypothetical protein
MKNFVRAFLLAAFALHFSARAQSIAGPHFGGAMNKLFGGQQAFSAMLEWQTADPRDGTAVTIPGKIIVDGNKSRFEVDMTQIKPNKISSGEAAQLKQFSMEKVVMIDRPDKKVSYMVYDGLQSCIENQLTDPQTIAAPDDFKMQTTKLGEETVDGHPCVKNQILVTDKQSNTNEFTTWNATDLKNFPVKIQTTDSGSATIMSFREISFAKPVAGLFEPPAGYTKYDSIMAMMRDQMMKQLGNAFGR